MSIGRNIVKGRSHFIFIAGLLAASAFILWAEGQDPDSWGQNGDAQAMAGAGPRIVAEFQDEASARRACATIQAASCRLIEPSKR